MAALCSVSDIISIYGQEGVNLTSADEWNPGSHDVNMVDDAIERAEQEVMGYLNRKYDLAQITGNNWVKWNTAYLAVGELAMRRGNSLSQSLIDRIQGIRDQLSDVINGNLVPPGLTPYRDLSPTMSNLTVDNRYRTARLRVQQIVSAGRSTSTQRRFREVYVGSLTWWGIY